ncbi:MAG: LURP-one-related family protein [Eubacteriales bacterium]
MNLYIKQKRFSFGDKYDIYDANQNVVYKAWGEIFAIANKLHLCNNCDEELMFIKQRAMTFLPTFELFVHGNLFATVKKEFTFFYKKINVESTYGNFVIDGNFWDHEYTITCDGKLFGKVSKEWLVWGDVYELDINTEEHSEFFVALVLAIDSILEGEKNR